MSTTWRWPARHARLVLAVLGVALVAMPFAFQMFERAPKGARMIASFRPYMTAARLGGYQLELREIGAGVGEGPLVAAHLYGSPASAGERRFASSYPDFAAFAAQWGGIDADMTSMLRTIQANLGNYEAVAALPSFTLFPWFFVIPGVLVLVLLALGLARAPWWRTARWVLVALGLGLVLAPAVFQMFSRAPKGGRMVTAFRPIETSARVARIQGYFAEIAVGQGAVQLGLISALQHSGLTSAQISSGYPGLATFDAQWVHILNDMTPMIGAMSDNVGNYEAVAALPPFALFPWFFVAPGLLVAAFALLAAPHGAPSVRREASSDLPNSLTEGVT
ncbi:MAG: hypothetical protein ABSF58_00760 [Solirubrobacteraceae bacterium]